MKVATNWNTVRILEILAKKERKFEEIEKLARIPEKVLSGLIKQMVSEELIENDREFYRITEKGTKFLERLK
ncbi:MAG: winged helix-turn-helix domain-containing protein [Archaeoglobales archaeon]|nr:winged helix-turn-helix domain-containing protein [Archaeoglobales archaeon]